MPGVYTRGLVLIGLVWLAGAGCGRFRDEAEISLSAGLRERSGVDAFAARPLGRTRMISTFDRSGGNMDWARWEGLEPDGLITIASLKGPGCIKRLWITNVPATRWLIFIDGEKEARIQGDGEFGLFGKEAPFLPPLCDVLSGGCYNYVPIPFSRSCRIAVQVKTFDPNMRPYYQVQYETYGPDVRVESFPRVLTAEHQRLLENARRVWEHPETEHARVVEALAPLTRFELAPGQSVRWLEATGPGTVTGFAVRLPDLKDGSAIERSRLLRELVLTIYWDGAEAPSVDVPLGDFFCNALNERAYASLPMANLGRVFVCRFPMPFGRSARGVIRHDGSRPVSLDIGVEVRPRAAETSAGRYFHATWNQAVGRGMPFGVLWASGPGHYVGCHLLAIGMDGSWNILEGDETFWLDGEPAPSWHGTGLEDYFNGGWYYYGLFERPLHGLIDKAPIRTAQYRFHLGDGIAFEKSLGLQFEFGDGHRARGYMAGTTYWYADRPRPCGSRVPPLSGRFPPADPLEPYAIMPNLFEFERLDRFEEAAERCRLYAEKFAGTPEADVARLRADAYREQREGFEAVRAAYEAVAAGDDASIAAQQARMLLWFHEKPDHAFIGANANGTFKLYLDGRPLMEGDHPLPLYVQGVSLAPGEHEITAEVTGAPHHPGFLAHVRTWTTNLPTDVSWQVTDRRPSGWPRSDDQSVTWQPARVHGLPPFMEVWSWTLNAFVAMQHGQRYLYAPFPWDAAAGPAYFRKRFVVPGSGSASITTAVPAENAADEVFRTRWDKASGVAPAGPAR